MDLLDFVIRVDAFRHELEQADPRDKVRLVYLARDAEESANLASGLKELFEDPAFHQHIDDVVSSLKNFSYFCKRSKLVRARECLDGALASLQLLRNAT